MIPKIVEAQTVQARLVTDRVFPHAYTFEAGVMYAGDTPGLGVEIDETLAASFPYGPAYVPVSRKVDGTLHSW